MLEMIRRNEQGNVLVFVIVGVLLTAALIGAVVTVRHFQKSGNDTVGTTSGPKSSDKSAQDGDSAPAESKPSDDQALKDALNAQSQAEKDKKAQSSTGNTSSQPQQQSSTTASGTEATTSAHKLPETGPESALIALLGASLLVGTGFAYTRSRRLI